MRLFRVAGLAMSAGVIGLAIYAAGEDDYYGDGTTRWGHATKDGHSEFVGALFAIPSLVALAFLVMGFLLRKRPSELWLIPAFAAYGLALMYAYALLSLGH